MHCFTCTVEAVKILLAMLTQLRGGIEAGAWLQFEQQHDIVAAESSKSRVQVFFGGSSVS